MAKEISNLEKFVLGAAVVVGGSVLFNAAYAVGYSIDKHNGGDGLTGGSIAYLGCAGLVSSYCMIRNKKKSKNKV